MPLEYGAVEGMSKLKSVVFLLEMAAEYELPNAWSGDSEDVGRIRCGNSNGPEVMSVGQDGVAVDVSEVVGDETQEDVVSSRATCDVEVSAEEDEEGRPIAEQPKPPVLSWMVWHPIVSVFSSLNIFQLPSFAGQANQFSLPSCAKLPSSANKNCVELGGCPHWNCKVEGSMRQVWCQTSVRLWSEMRY